MFYGHLLSFCLSSSLSFKLISPSENESSSVSPSSSSIRFPLPSSSSVFPQPKTISESISWTSNSSASTSVTSSVSINVSSSSSSSSLGRYSPPSEDSSSESEGGRTSRNEERHVGQLPCCRLCERVSAVQFGKRIYQAPYPLRQASAVQSKIANNKFSKKISLFLTEQMTTSN